MNLTIQQSVLITSDSIPSTWDFNRDLESQQNVYRLDWEIITESVMFKNIYFTHLINKKKSLTAKYRINSKTQQNG